MDYDSTIFWFICLASFTGMVSGLIRFRSGGRGSALISAFILLVALVGKLLDRSGFIYGSLGLWLLLILCPGLLNKQYYRRVLEQNYSAAGKLARIISWLHPVQGWREQPRILRALELAQMGEMTAASESLDQLQRSGSPVALLASANLYRLSGRWEEMLQWGNAQAGFLLQNSNFLHLFLRACGETGDLVGLVELYQRHKPQIARLSPPASRDLCRLMLFAFTGHRDVVETLFAGSLSPLPASTQKFWLATADLAAGSVESGKHNLEGLLPIADAPLRLAIERRLARITVANGALDSAAADIVESASRDYRHDHVFGAQRTLFSREARATQMLIVVNLLMFLAELRYSNPMDPFGLFRLGALYPPVVRAGEWWRLITSTFLHFGPLHLSFNMLGLWILGPFVEFALGFRRFLFVYLVAGISSMGFVMTYASGPNGEQLTVGASGAIMGLIGATGALMLRGWLREKAVSARRRLMATLLIVVMQTMFDAVVPNVSMAAHLSGAVMGFFLTLLFRDRLTTARVQDRSSEANIEARDQAQAQRLGGSSP